VRYSAVVLSGGQVGAPAQGERRSEKKKTKNKTKKKIIVRLQQQ